MFAVVAHFDQRTESSISSLWKGLSDRSISNYAYEVIDRKPHITLADYSSIDDDFLSAFDYLYSTQAKVPVIFNTLSTFIKTGTLLLTPTPSKELMDLHNKNHIGFSKYADPQSLYLPNKWTPHCTIANRLSPDKLTEAFNYCTEQLDVLNSEIVQISVIKIAYKANRAVRVSIINNAMLSSHEN
ncbi:2'-5' RNA ligase family protein [Paenibacillus harenae]|uniref:2'-5' RNA ligase n=1 Tax=Paenibacillus harenae TaxID=306543 RepID=A0ABT9UB03_PAEHA|nr:2'-5' RNA ligase family protein [Paenibacillus harenae]MDQ0116778.1 2'-5' RNA ligase [Paenibacillus harenae]